MVIAPADTTDFTPYMEQILDSGAEAWVVTWAGGGFIPMMQAAVDLGLQVVIDGDGVACREQRIYKMRADKAGPAGDYNHVLTSKTVYRQDAKITKRRLLLAVAKFVIPANEAVANDP